MNNKERERERERMKWFSRSFDKVCFVCLVNLKFEKKFYFVVVNLLLGAFLFISLSLWAPSYKVLVLI